MLAVYYVYALFRLDGTICYIGKGKDNRWLAHEKSNNFKNYYLRAVVLQAKSLGKKLPKVKIREDLTEQEAFETEVAFIAAIGRRNIGTGPLTNLTDGGEGASGNKFPGRKLSEETRLKIAVSLRGKPKMLEHNAKVSAAQKGKKKIWTEEGRANFIASHTDNQHHLGFKHSEEARAKIREARSKQAPHSEETIRKLSDLWRGRQHSEESKAKMRASWVIRKSKKLASSLEEM